MISLHSIQRASSSACSGSNGAIRQLAICMLRRGRIMAASSPTGAAFPADLRARKRVCSRTYPSNNAMAISPLDVFSIQAKTYFVVLDYSDAPAGPTLPDVEQWLETARAFWDEWNLFNYYRGPHEKVVRRSAVTLKLPVTLKLLPCAPTGAFVAAPTTSLPEKIGGDGTGITALPGFGTPRFSSTRFVGSATPARQKRF